MMNYGTLFPFCDSHTPAEPDAQWVYCIHYKSHIEITCKTIQAGKTVLREYETASLKLSHGG